MLILEWLSTPTFKALAWSLLHNFWQAGIIYLITFLLLHINKNAPARIKYNIASGAQLLIVFWFIQTFIHYLSLQSDLTPILEKGQAAMLFNPAHMPLLTGLYDTPAASTLTSLDQLFPFLLLIYLLGLLFMSIRLLNSYRLTRFLRKTSLLKIDPAIQQHVNRIAGNFKIQRPILIGLSRYINVPVMMGYMKPIILLPVSILTHLSADQLQAILTHEIAHIRRLDYLVNIFQSIIETFFFFNPFVWLLSGIIREEREKACDESVIKEVAPFSYASALLALEKARSSTPLAMAAIGKKQTTLLNRIKSFTMNRRPLITLKQKTLSLLLIILSLGCIAWLSPKDKTPGSNKTANSNLNANVENTGNNSLTQNISPSDTIPQQHSKLNRQQRISPDKEESALTPEWQESLVQIQKQAKQMALQIQNDSSWKKQVKLLQQNAEKLDTHFKNNPEWERSMRQLQNNAQKFAVQIKENPAFKARIKAIQDSALVLSKLTSKNINWNNHLDALVKQSTEMAARIKNDPAWASQIKLLQSQALKITKDFENNPEWKKQIEMISKQAEQISKKFTENPDWKQHLNQLMIQTEKLKSLVPPPPPPPSNPE